ncbi:hypothetical protein GUITHDRAFT_143184 [Guillardia theta CCMP2712]|uniref:Uncharacterized protein n=1 Tax=Guillardia theta (strain CCMP2712) TaxID=905079 RepID=L1IU76_GUITC|nr:hypothetical protein GUITHDRAFT_143184 [Guillardia theta CCMP2712]EKX39791.1 hypothetical protein GUITHDRAFT_143184 [Guillardia theta CCMP2712]|eukprot:XP_005826771.1 hypothetical protein GUITHDRAFT_143184 [Guillardia theta CCMP2712]
MVPPPLSLPLLRLDLLLLLLPFCLRISFPHACPRHLLIVCCRKLFLSSPSSPLLRLQVCGSSVARAGTLRLRLEEKLAAFDDAASYWEVFRDPKALKRMTELGEMAGASKAGGGG